VPIHDQSYRRYGGERQPAQRAWLVIAKSGIQQFLRKRPMIGILFGSQIALMVRLVAFYLSESITQAQALLGPSAKTFRDFLEQQNFFVFLIAVYVGSGLIAQDRKANALQIYLSKPLTRLDYIAGKMAILGAFLLFVTWLPAMLLLFGQILLSGSFEFARANLILFPAITVFSFLEVFIVCCAVLALSSLTTSTRYVAVMFAGVMFFSEAIYGTLRMVTGSTAVSWVSFTGSLAQVGDFIFRQPLRYTTPVAVSFIVLLALVAVAISVLERRVRGVEVVA
jgi:ABC-type transport system involved in multi-copper enzyme maturation permease subunit